MLGVFGPSGHRVGWLYVSLCLHWYCIYHANNWGGMCNLLGVFGPFGPRKGVSCNLMLTFSIVHTMPTIEGYVFFCCALLLTSRCQIVHFYTTVPNCPRCQIVHGAKLSAVPNCPLLDCGVKMSAVLNCPLYTTVPNCPGAKLSTFTLRCQIVCQHGRCQIVLGAKLSQDHFESFTKI